MLEYIMIEKRPTGEMKTARFWIRWRGSWVKLALIDGETVSLFSAESTEEGYRQEWATYQRVGNEIRCDLSSRERDCDGVYDHSWDAFCDATELRSCAPYDSSDETYSPELGSFRCLPNWQEIDTRQRDYTAEASGY